MAGVTEGSAEEFYAWFLGNARILEASCRAHAEESDVVSAVSAALGADISTLESLVWERINVAPRAPQRQFYQAGLAMAGALAGLGDHPMPGGASAADLVRAIRTRLTQSLEASLASDVVERWPAIDCLEALPTPRGVDFASAVDRRLGGLSTEQFVLARRTEARDAHLAAQASRIRGATGAAIASAYEGDFLSLEAYLVESALAAGDTAMITVAVRWDLATHAVSQLAGLPDGFSAAVTVIRRSLAEGLGPADGQRLLATLPVI